MFRKTVTRLAYSPTLAEELTDYAKRLRREEAKRQIGLIFVVLALVVQSFAVLFPPESANAGDTTDFIEGGFSTIDGYLTYYDRDTHNIKALLTSLGVSRTDIQNTHPTTLSSSPDLLLWKMTSRGDSSSTAYDFMTSDGGVKAAYYQPLSTNTSSHKSYAAFVGSSLSAGWFAILKDSGNLVTKTSIFGSCASNATPPALPAVPISFSDIKRCNIKLTPNLSARSLTSNTSVTSQAAQPSDRIVYTLTMTNNDGYAVSIPPSIGLADILEYAQLIDKGGANFNQDTQTLTWAAATIPAHGTVTRNFIIKLLPVIPSTAIGQTDPFSYDCVMSGSFGNTLNVPVACPFPKTVERIINQLPSTSIQTNLIFAAIITLVTVYFYARSRQLRTELRLIRHSYQGNL